MTINKIIGDFISMKKTNEEKDIGMLMDNIKANSTLRVHTYYEYNDMNKFQLYLVNKYNDGNNKYLYTKKAGKLFNIL